MRLLPLIVFALAASLAVAAPVKRTLTPGAWDLDLDGIGDLSSATSDEGSTNSIPGSTFGTENLYPRVGMEFLLNGSLSLLPLLPLPTTLSEASTAWTAGPGGFSLGRWQQSGNEPKTFYSGVFANAPSGWIGFRLQRDGHWYYGALQGRLGTLSTVIIESETDTPITIPDALTLVQVQFGTTDLGGYATRCLSVTNDQTTPLTNLAFTIEGPDAADFMLDAPAISELAPGATANFSVTFVPAIQGKVSTAAVHVGKFNFALSATGGRSLIPVRVEEVGGNVITPLSLPSDFGSPMVGDTTAKSFRITNLGTAPIINLQASVDEPLGALFYWGEPSYPTGVEHALIFKWLPTTGPVRSGFGVNSSPPAILSSGESTTISIRWSPYETQAKTRTIRVAGSNSVPANIVVTGAATPYVYTSPKLAGLHYRFGESADWLQQELADGDKSTLATYNLYPEASGLTPLTARRWSDLVPDNFSFLMRDLDSRWEASQMLYLETTSSSGGIYSETSGSNSAWSKMGSRVGLETDLAAGRYLRSGYAALKLPATDRVGMELWMKPVWVDDQPIPGAQSVSFVGQTADAGFGVWLVDGALQGRAGASRVTMPAPLSADWHHVALLLNGGRLSLRVDGVESANTSEASLPSTVTPLTVGAMYDGRSPAKVIVDELRLFELADDFDPTTDLLLTAKPAASVDKTTLNFGDVPLWMPSTQTFNLTNMGPGWLRIVSATITGEAAAEYRYQSAQSELLQPDRPADPTYAGGTLSLGGGMLIQPSRVTLESAVVSWLGDNMMVTALAPGASMRIDVLHLPGALGSRAAMLTLTTDDPAHPTFEIQLGSNATPALPPQLSLSSKEWQWGTLGMEESLTMEFYPSNSGGEPLTQVQAEIVGPYAGDYTLTTSGFSTSTVWPPREYQFGMPVQATTPGAVILPPKFTVTVQPRAVGPRLAWLRIHSNDPARPVTDIPMYGLGISHDPHIEVKGMLYYPDPLAYGAKSIPINGTMDFGTLLRTTDTSAGYVEYFSTGTGPLTISRVTVSGPNASDFMLDPAGTGSLQPGHEGTTSVKFTPTGEGLRTATLRIESNDAKEGVYEITLTGRLLPPTPVLVVDQGGMNPMPLANEFLRLGTGVVRGFRNAGYTLPTKTFSLKNTGAAPLTSARLRFTGPNADEFTATIPASIEPDASAEIVVTFDPAEVGPRSAVLHIETNAGIFGEVPAGGTGAYGAKASLSPQLPDGWVTTAMAEYLYDYVLIAGYVGDEDTRTYLVQIYRLDGTLVPSHIRTDGVVRSLSVKGSEVAIAGDYTLIYDRGRTWYPAGVEHATLNEPLNAVCQGVAIWNPSSELEWTNSSGLPTFSFMTIHHPLTLAVTGDFAGRAAVALPDGKVLVGGSGSLGGRKNLIRLNADGTLDTTFTLPEPDGPVNALALQDDGRVLVGGEFTNLGQAYVPGPFPHYGMADPSRVGRLALYGEIVAGSEAGLCRLNIDGTNDLTFGNPGFHSVTALAVQGDRVAVGGIERREAFSIVDQFLFVTSPPINPPPPLNVSCARLLSLSGQTLARTDMDATPRVVALQPGDRMHVAPGNFLNLYPLPLHPSVALVQPISACSDFWGIIAETTQPIVTDGSLVLAPGPQIFHFQQFEGDINAMLPQADGKMLVGGALTKAYVDSVRGDDSTTEVPRSDETPIRGFAQLDSDGFFTPSLASPPYSDGLTRLTVPAITTDDALQLGVGVWVHYLSQDTTLEFDGPDAAAFYTTIPPVTRSLFVGAGYSVTVQCSPKRSGIHRAVLHLRQPGFANAFDIGVECRADITGAPDFHIVDADSFNALTNGANEDFGSVFVGEESPKILRIVNDSAASITTPLTMTLFNPDDFSISKAPDYPIASDASSDFIVTFKPKFNGRQQSTRTAVLRISDGSSGTPIEINLTGEAFQQGLIIDDPHDALVLVGQSITLTAYPQGAEPLSLQWLKDGKTIAGATGNTLTIPAAKLTDAGYYALRATNLSSSTTSKAALVGVVDMKPQTISSLAGKPLIMECKVAGPSLGCQFQWFKDGIPLATAGGRSAKLNLKRLEASQAGDYACEVSMGTARLVTPPITLRLYLPPVLSQGFASTTWQVAQPVNDRITAQSLAPLAVVVHGLPPGVALDMRTGIAGGKPTKAGTYRVQLVAWNRQGHSAVLDQIITVLPWGGFVGTAHGSVIRPSNAPVGEWTITTTGSGTFTAKLREGRSRIAAGKDAGGHALFGGITTTAFVGTLSPLPKSADDETGRMGASITRGKSERFDLTLGSYANGQPWLRFTRTDETGRQTIGVATPLLATLPVERTGSFISDPPAIGSSQPGTTSSTPGYQFILGSRGACTWAARIGGDFGIRAVAGSSPLHADEDGWPAWKPFAVAPDRNGGRVVVGEGWHDSSQSQILTFGGGLAECTGTLEEPTDAAGEHYYFPFIAHRKQ